MSVNRYINIFGLKNVAVGETVVTFGNDIVKGMALKILKKNFVGIVLFGNDVFIKRIR
jgi:hypothetical protein